MAASSLLASFLGARAIDRAGVDGVALMPLLAFVGSVLLSVYVLAPKSNLEFALRGSEVWEYFVSEDDDLAEAHRTLAYWIDDVRANNQGLIDRLLICFSIACVGLVIEAVLWALELGGTLT